LKSPLPLPDLGAFSGVAPAMLAIALVPLLFLLAMPKSAPPVALAPVDVAPMAAAPIAVAAAIVAPPVANERAAMEPVRSAGPPPVTEAPSRTHVVVGGDTLSKLSLRYLHDSEQWPRFMRANPRLTNPDLIRPGQHLRVPER
jgi:nucleoid-associated protein YgaU